MNIKNAKILVVDDEATNVKLMVKVLELGNFNNIFSTQNPIEVLKLQQQENFQLIILDINMPVMDGFQVLEQLKDYYKEKCPPILVLTAQSQLEHKQKALLMGANDYLTKPFDQVEVLARASNLLKVKTAHDEVEEQKLNLEKIVAKRTEELALAHNEIYESRLQVVRKLGRAAEYRDNETGLHIIRMSQIASLIGQKIGMSEEEYILLLNASPMHDIGKIGIPDKILLKPGKLTPEEWEIMKTHTTIGADILASGDSDLLRMAHIVALTHHEKFDGSGYPQGLSKEKIPIVGRITALADVFDALTSERPYKKAWPLDETLDYIRQHSGSQFDPILVDIFFQVIENILEIKDKNSEPGTQSLTLEYRSFNSNNKYAKKE